MNQDRDERNDRQPRLVFLLSGGGRTLANLLTQIRDGAISAEVARVISSRKKAGGNDIATDAGIPLSVVPRRQFDDVTTFSETVFKVLDGELPDLVVCGGFLSKLVVPERYMGKIVNIHPSLLPLFGGRGYYGDRVHHAVLDSGMRVSGCTVHFLNNDYDAGPIIAQECVPVKADDTVETLASRVFALECAMYPSVIRGILTGSIWLDVERGRVIRG